MDATIRFAEDIAGRLGEVPGVAAVALGGSWARGEARPDSDVDLGLYYSPDVPRTSKTCAVWHGTWTTVTCPSSSRT